MNEILTVLNAKETHSDFANSRNLTRQEPSRTLFHDLMTTKTRVYEIKKLMKRMLHNA